MKKTTILFILILSVSVLKAQTIDNFIFSKVDSISAKKVEQLEKSLDVITVKNFTATGTTNIDTLTAPLNGNASYRITITSNTPKVVCAREFYVYNDNGVMSVTQQNIRTFSGISGGSLTASVINGLVVVRLVTGTITAKFKTVKTNL